MSFLVQSTSQQGVYFIIMMLQMDMQQFPYPGLSGERFPEETIYVLALIGFIFLALSVPHYIASERQSGMKVSFIALYDSDC